MKKQPNELRSFRIQNGYSEKQVAGYLGIKHPETITRWEKGETMPNSMNILAMGELCKIQLSEMYPALWKKCVREVDARLKQFKKKTKK